MALATLDWAASTSVSSLSDSQITELCSFAPTNSSDFQLNGFPLTNSSFAKEKPSYFLVWTVGLGFVTIINMCAVVGIAVMRYLSKNVYNQVITYFVGLGVGSLSGSSLYHLLPQAHPSLLEQVNEKGEPTHEYLTMATFSLIGVYTFFFADKLIKVILEGRKKGSGGERGRVDHERSPEYSARPDLALLNGKLDTVKLNTEEDVMEMERMEERACRSMGNQAHGICSHEHDLLRQSDSPIAAVAWMILFGDGLHNLIDGISIGAAFGESMHSGLSVSIAVLAEEFPHELGDVAILVASGLTLRQALLYNLMSALTCYIGFVIGVVVGEIDPDTTKYAFALAGGMFLYISLACMMPEMKKAMEEALAVSLPRGIYVFVLQAAGLFSGLFLMYFMARYGGEFSF